MNQSISPCVTYTAAQPTCRTPSVWSNWPPWPTCWAWRAWRKWWSTHWSNATVTISTNRAPAAVRACWRFCRCPPPTAWMICTRNVCSGLRSTSSGSGPAGRSPVCRENCARNATNNMSCTWHLTEFWRLYWRATRFSPLCPHLDGQNLCRSWFYN